MKDTVKRLISFRFDRYKDTEIKLEKLAAKGLFLHECSSFLWTFRKGEPRDLKYTVTYFCEGSIFNPDITDNQQNYLDYAKSAGWNFVTQYNQMQIFFSEIDNPIPFETDETEKFKNIKRCMKKSFLPSMIVMLLVFMLNLGVQFSSFRSYPIEFLSDPTRLLAVIMFALVVGYDVYLLIDYFIWCKRVERSIANGGECSQNNSRVRRIIDITVVCAVFGILVLDLFYVAQDLSWMGILFCVAQMPIMLIIFWSSIKYLKKKKVSARRNKVISYTLLVVGVFAYLALMMVCIMSIGVGGGNESDYRTVTWQMSPTASMDYKLYSEKIPLTCEDLYGEIDYDYYSYEKEADSTIFLRKNSYRQESLPGKDAPPRLEYNVLEPRFDFAYRMTKNQLLEIPEWQESASFKTIDKEIFKTIEAYQKYYDNTPTGEYILMLEGKIIVLYTVEPLTAKQITVVKEKLEI